MTAGRIPAPIAVRSGIFLTVATALAMAGEALFAVTYRVPTNEFGVDFGSGSMGFGTVRLVDRLGLFAEGATTLTWALMLAMALIVLAMSSETEAGEGVSAARRRLVVGVAVLAWVIVVADLVMCILIIGVDQPTRFVGTGSGSDRLGSVMELLGPVVLAAGVLGYARRQLATEPGETETDPA